MSNSTTYIGFSSIDYKGVNSLSSYALPLTPVKFIINRNEIDNHKRAVWDFGDGTTSNSISASKYFQFPGTYPVSLIVYDCNNNALISTETKTITVYDYNPFTFNIDLSSSEIEMKCGEIFGPIKFNAYYPVYQPASNIFYSVSGSNSRNYWNLPEYKFNHLERTYSLYDKTYNYAISSYQYSEVDKIVPQVSKIYGRIIDNVIVYCSENDSGAVYMGLSGTKDIYIKDDSISDRIDVKFWFDKTNNFIPKTVNAKFTNVLGITLSASVLDNPVTRMSITSNGLDGEGFPIDSFNIDSVKLFDTNIPFLVKIKDVNNFTVKNFDKIALSALSFEVDYTPTNVDIVNDEFTYTTFSASSSDYSISDLNYLMSEGSGGYFRGYITFPLSSYDYLDSVRINVSGTVESDQLSSYSLSCQSNAFNVYKKNFYDLWVKNEDFNPMRTLMDLRFQEVLIDKKVLFEDFFGGVLGGDNTTHDDIGVAIYEKIANYVSNTQDIDSCGQEFIDSMGDFTGYDDNIGESYAYPESIKRLISLASMDKLKLIGSLNSFKENFDIRGRTSKDVYGTNIGSEIDTTSYVISAGTPVVALEKFSNNYTLLNTYQPVSAVGSHIYPLSSYSLDWGWPLVLPVAFSFEDVHKYYNFFDYVEGSENSSTGGLIDFNNSKTSILTTTSYSELFGVDGIFENMFIDTLYQSLSLVQ